VFTEKGEMALMNSQNNNTNDFYVIDLLHIVRTLWRRAWVIVLSALLAAGIGFSVATFAIEPTYSSAIMLYINNSSVSIEDLGFSISSSEISAAQSLVKTYIVLLQNRTTLEKVIEKADVDYTYEDLEDMISASAVNETEVLQITVTSDDPYEAAKIVNAIAEVLPRRITEIIDGSTMAVVDSGAVDLQKVFPSITGFTALGLLLGAIVSVVILSLLAIGDDTIRNEEYILQNYDYPILAKIPDLVNTGNNKSYGYYYKNHQKHAALD
jgi:capsular polysaccharide biosynthesis protein